jgi:tRNA-2-methylthio-N6-dimethylallyladenosine synthase
MYNYSERPGTLAARKYPDDVPEEVKGRRLQEIIATQNAVSRKKNNEREGKTFRVLVEGTSKKSANDLRGRNDENMVVIFPKENYKPGDYVDVIIEKSSTTSLVGKAIGKAEKP